MSEPQEVLSQLLSPAQAETLDATGRESWQAAAAALAAIQGAAPAFAEASARLVMPDEITKEFAEPHLSVPLELSTDQDQTAMAYLVVPTSIAAAFLASQADNPNDEEQQTIVMASTVIGQVVQALNAQVFAKSSAGLVVAIDEVAANAMPATLAEMDEPCMYLTGAVAGGKALPITLVLPGTFLDIMATAMAGAVSAPVAASEEMRSVAAAAAASEFSFELTQDDLEAAELLEELKSASPCLRPSAGGASPGRRRRPRRRASRRPSVRPRAVHASRRCPNRTNRRAARAWTCWPGCR